MIALDENGNFITNSNNRLTQARRPDIQNAQAESRCVQGQYAPDLTYGKNYLTWYLSDSVSDRANDLYRIASKYTQVISVIYIPEKQEYSLQC